MNNFNIWLLKMKLKISNFNPIEFPLTKKKLIDKKKVRHVYKIEIADIKAFYCMINGKAYLINYNEKLEQWLNLSEIEIKPSTIINYSKNIGSVGNLKEFKGK